MLYHPSPQYDIHHQCFGGLNYYGARDGAFYCGLNTVMDSIAWNIGSRLHTLP